MLSKLVEFYNHSLNRRFFRLQYISFYGSVLGQETTVMPCVVIKTH